MNKRVHRLVFDRKRGMRVPAAEHARSAGKCAGGQTRAVAVASAALVLNLAVGVSEAQARTLAPTVQRATNLWAKRTNPDRNLPVPSASRQSGNVGVFNYWDGGIAKDSNGQVLADQNFTGALWTQDPASKRLVIEQKDSRILINWDSFNIAPGHEVQFVQPEFGSAHNKIWDMSPSLILGSIKANAEIVLENQNGGFVFGSGARVDTGRLVVSALSMAKALERKLTGLNLDDYRMFGSDADTPVYVDEDGVAHLKAVTVEAGAEIKTLAGGEVIMVAPTVYNEGRIDTPEGQTILAAGQKVYLMSAKVDNDQSQRGLVVAVDAFKATDLPTGVNTVEHAVNATVRAEKGSINLVGMAIRQNGLLSATTAVKGRNGVITLEASESADIREQAWSGVDATGLEKSATLRRPVGMTWGSIEFGSASKTEIKPSLDASETQFDADVFLRSRISAIGADVLVKSGAQIVAPSGNIELLAAQSSDARGNPNFVLGNLGVAPEQDSSRLVVERGALISAAGERGVRLPMSRNQITGSLFKGEFADQPVQRDGPLYRQEVSFDARKPIRVANVKGFYEGIKRSAQEWSTQGGNVTLMGGGSVVVADGAQIDVSGGSVFYEKGQLSSTQLRKGTQVLSLADAQAGVSYDALLQAGNSNSNETLGYEQGFDAGSITLSAKDKLYVDLQGLRGDVVVGPLQRVAQLSGDYSGNRLISRAIGTPVVLRDKPYLYSELRPLGGSLNIGAFYGSNYAELNSRPDAALTQVTFTAASPAAPVDESSDALLARLPQGAQIDTSAWAATGLAKINVQAGKAEVQGGVSLDMGASGGLNITALDGITMAGQVRAPDGQVSLDSRFGDVVLEAGARIDLSGHKVDEQLGGSGPETLAVDGGTFKAMAGRGLWLQEGSAVDVSAGLWRAASGAVKLGEAGEVSLTLARGLSRSGLSMRLGGELAGYGFSSGGTIKIKGLRTLTLGGLEDTTQEPSWDLVLSPAWFSANGFGKFELQSESDVKVLAGAQITPLLTSLTPRFSQARNRSGNGVGDAASLTSFVQLPQGQRAPVQISLSATGVPAFSRDDGNAIDGVTQAGSVSVAQGAGVNVGPGGTLSLRAAGNIDVAGKLLALSGSVSLGLLGERGGSFNPADVTGTGSNDKIGYLPEQAITLRTGAEIDVSGVDNTYLGLNGARQGDVLGGGSVKINVSDQSQSALRGKVITETGSMIRADGAIGLVRLGNTRSSLSVSKDAGSISVASADGLVLQGDMSAKRLDSRAQGGRFVASLSREGLGDAYDTNRSGQAYPDGERALSVVAGAVQTPASVAGVYGLGEVSARTLQAGGFEHIHLRSEGRVVLGDGVDLQAAPGLAPLRSVVLNAPVLEVAGTGTREVKAHYVALGDVNHAPLDGAQAPSQTAPVAGSAALRVQAGLIEVHGHSALQGSQDTILAATLGADGRENTRRDGEIRFIGRVFGKNSNTLDGRLAFDGQLTLQAGQVYGTTLSRFTVDGLPGTSRLMLAAPEGGSTSQAPLSALARLTLQAHDVSVNSVVRQPFGAITIQSETKPLLGPDSLLSVSGDGLAVPVGTTFNQTQWVYDTAGIAPGETVITDAASVQTLSNKQLDKSILVKGQGLLIDSQSSMQAQAGGDLLTWEFLSGVSGSTDTLARQNVFAVLPNYTYDFAPYDTEIMASQAKAGTSLTPADQLDIYTPNGVLAAGRYTLLPARYALLPGAVLVSKVQQGTGTLLKTAGVQDDGSVLVSGQQVAPGGTAQNDASVGADTRVMWQLEPEQTFRAKSDLSIQGVSQVLRQQAAKRGLPTPTLPSTAGRVSLVSDSEDFTWAARYNLAGGQLDLSMKNMQLVADDEPVLPGQAVVRASQLTGTQAASILLGGERSGVAEATIITTHAEQVSVSGQVTAGELLVTAKKDLILAPGAALVSNGLDDGRLNDITVMGSGAALVVSNRQETTLKRKLAAGVVNSGAILTIQGGVTLDGQAVQIDSSDRIERAADLNIKANTLGLGAREMTLGDGVASADDAGVLSVRASDLADRKRIELRSYTALNMDGSQSLGQVDPLTGRPVLQKLVLDAPTVVGRGTSGDVVQVRAQQVVLRNGSTLAPDAALTGLSRLDIVASPGVKDATAEGITLGDGVQRLAFSHTDLGTSGDIVIRGSGSTVAQKDITLTAARVTGESGAERTIDASNGVIRVKPYQGSTPDDRGRTLNDVVGSGARLTLQAQRVLQEGTIDLPSGYVKLVGTGTGASDPDNETTVVFAQGSQTLARGYDVMQNGKKLAVAPGGVIEAQASSGWIDLRGVLDVSVPDASQVSQVGVAAGQVVLTASALGGGLVFADTAQIQGQSATPALSGSLKLDLGRLLEADTAAPGPSEAVSEGALDALATLTQAGKVGREIEIRVRQGDLALSTQLSVGRLIVSADAGSIDLRDGAYIHTTQSAARGGVVQLSARDDVTLHSGARIDASASAQGANGGDVLLASSLGFVTLDQGSSVVAGVAANGASATQGRVVLRATSSTTKDSDNETVHAVQAKVASGSVQAGEVILEAVHLTDLGDANVTINQALRNALHTQADTFMTQAERVWLATGLDGIANSRLRVGTELRTRGNITLDSDWNLYRNAGANPINLSLRAGGDLTLNGSISDGFVGTTRAAGNTPSAMGVGDGGSLRLIAGADTTAANVMQTRRSDAAGSLTIAGNKMVRTTNGSIELAAARDIVLSASPDKTVTSNTSQAVVYVAGKTAGALNGETSTPSSRSVWQRFTNRGGRLELNAGRDIKAPAATQGFGNWFLHTGRQGSSVAWAPDFDAFRQGAGSMGGDGLRITAGRHIDNLGAISTSSARTFVDEQGSLRQHIENGGDVLVRAGGDVRGGAFFLGRGQGHVEAGGSVLEGDAVAGLNLRPMAPVLGLMDGQWRLQSRGDLNVSAIYNPTALESQSEASSNPKAGAAIAGSYLSYGDTAAAALSSVNGAVQWRGDMLQSTNNANVNNWLTLHNPPGTTTLSPANEQLRVSTNNAAGRQAIHLAPAILEMTSYNSDVVWRAGVDDLMLAPSPQGNLRWYANNDVKLEGGKDLYMLDLDLKAAAAAVAGSLRAPQLASVDFGGISQARDRSDGIHAMDDRPAAIMAGRDMVFSSGASLVVRKPIDVIAQRDILAPSVTVSHWRATDVSRVQAGGNIEGATNTSIERPNGLIRLDGPGELQVQAGRTLDLSTSGGIEARGDGAWLRVAAGMNKQVDVDALEAAFLRGDANAKARQALIDFVQSTLNVSGLDDAQALAYLRQMKRENQVLFAETKLLMPRFAERFLSDDSSDPDLVWTWAARSAGVDVSDRNADLYKQYLAAQRALLSYVKSESPASVTFAQALNYYRNDMTSAQRATFIDKNRLDPAIAMGLLSAKSMSNYAQAWKMLVAAQPAQAKASETDLDSPLFRRFVEQVLLNEVRRLGGAATAVADSANELFNPRRKAVREAIWRSVSSIATLAGLNEGFQFAGNLDLSGSKIHTLGAGNLSQGGMDLLVPGGEVLVGSATATANDRAQAATRGLAAYGGGSINAYSSGDFQVASQKVHVVGAGNVLAYSTQANVDSGRGSNTAVTTPPKQAVDDGYGTYKWVAAETTVGSGIGIFENAQGVREGTLRLYAPNGEVRALDAFISAPTIELGSPVVLGADNLKGGVSGAAETRPIAVNLSINSGLGTETAAGQAEQAITQQQAKPKERSSLLTVDVLSLGDASNATPAAAPNPPAVDRKTDAACKEDKCKK